MSSRRIRIFSVSALILLAFCSVGWPLSVWKGTTKDWHTASNWDPVGVPGAGADVLITNAANDVELSADTAALNSLIISNNTLTFINWDTELYAEDVTIRYNGKFTLPGDFLDNEMSNRVHVVCTNMTIEIGGVIDADGLGYDGDSGPGKGGPNNNVYAGGGGYGGHGGVTRDTSKPGLPYGSVSAPLDPGSGGGHHDSPTYAANAGSGGGAVWIDSLGTVTVHGTITANGDPSTGIYASGGSGGSIYIQCDAFGGSTNGLLSAGGGQAYSTAYNAAGGGGRIAVHYNSVTQPFVRFSAAPGAQEYATADIENRRLQRARAGTLWVPNMALFDALLSQNQFGDIRVYGPTSWNPTSLTVSNCNVTFAENGFELLVDGALRIDSNGALGLGTLTEGTNFTLKCDGNLIVTNGGTLSVYGGSTNGTGFNYGALVQVTNDLRVGPSSWVYCYSHETNGGSPRFVMDNLYVAAGGGFNANGIGYIWRQGPGTPAGNGTEAGGAGYGGKGGSDGGGAGGVDNDEGGDANGSAAKPFRPGSGGGGHYNYPSNPGGGGGVIRLEATGTATINGTLTANGADGVLSYGGGGAGGGIYVKCDTLGGSASGLIRASGGDACNTTYTAGGGGGRIALDYQTLGGTHDIRFETSPAASESAILDPDNRFIYRAQAGTLWLPDTGLLSAVLKDQFTDVRIFGISSWSPNSLTVSNCSITFAETEFALTVANDIQVDSGGSLGIGDYFTGKDASLSYGSNYALRCAGSITLTNGGDLYVYSGLTNGTGKDYGVLVKVTNDVAVGPGSWIVSHSHRIDGGSPLFSISNLFVAATGGIKADSRGYGYRQGPGVGTIAGTYCGGGGYGGRGGAGSDEIEGGMPYGSPHMPLAPGSSGSSHSNYKRHSGQGGGAIRIEASGTVTVNGTITSNGAKTQSNYAGGGSGGGIYVKCDTFGGSGGMLRAEGGESQTPTANSQAGSGGGGRIAVDYDTLAGAHDVSFSVAAPDESWGFLEISNRWQFIPRVGTVSLPDAQMLSETIDQDFAAGDVSLFFQDIDQWGVDHLIVTNCWVAFGDDNFSLIVTNDVTVGTGGALGLGHYHDGSNYTLSVGGSLILTNGGDLHVFGGLTNAMGEGDVSAVVEITNDLVVGSGSWVYPSSHDTDGGAPVFRMRDLVVRDGGGFDANCKGYRALYGPGVGADGSKAGGGGYGGKGGDGSTGNAGGLPYGLTNGPALPGSSGGCLAGNLPYIARGGQGGGAIRVESRRNVTVDGTLEANGGEGFFSGYGGGGAGGGIYIVCSNFSGAATGLMQARGNDSYNSNTSDGGGGGGRITVWKDVPYADRTNHLAGGTVENLQISSEFLNYDGGVSVTNGVGATSDPAEPGTAFFIRKSAGNAYELQIDGDPDDYDTPSPLGYSTHIDIPADTRITNSVTSPFDEGGGLRRMCLGFTLEDYDDTVLSNKYPGTQAEFNLTTNLTLTWHWTNQWLLTVGHQANGNVNSNIVNGWYTNAVSVTGITATAAGGYFFNGWIGDVPVGHEADNPLEVTMDQARSITGTFAEAVTVAKTWTGTGTWDTAGNWDPSGVPTSLDDVTVKSGWLIVAQQRYARNVTVSNGATLVFTNWTAGLNASANVTIQSNGLMTSWGSFTNNMMSNRVNVACSNLIVDAGGEVSVEGQGWRGWNGPGAGEAVGTYCSGGGYGGRGGYGRRQTEIDKGRGKPYGSAAMPLQPGSGGGSHVSYQYHTGAGGGAIRIDAGTAVIVNGTINADGGDSSGQYGGGGSGGGIYITCETLGGTNGTVRAQGGDATGTNVSGGGSGGRIAVHYQDLAPGFGVSFVASPADVDYGVSAMDERAPHAAEMGTLWLPDTNLVSSVVTGGRFVDCKLLIDGVSTLVMPSLTVSNASFTFPTNGFELRIAGDLLIGNGGGVGIGTYSGNGSNYLLTCGGTLTLTNGGTLTVYAGLTNGTPGDEGALVAVTNDIVIGPSSWIYAFSHWTNAGSPRFTMDNLRIASGGGINASARGYRSYYGPGRGVIPGTESGGAGYGGRGGTGEDPLYGGDAYGSVSMPLEPGSGGASHISYKWGAGSGGGLIRVEARGTISVDGTVKANGAPSLVPYGGGGSGGGIYLECDTFGGSGGLVSADGGNGWSTNAAGSGGGGRIAVDYSGLSGSPTVSFTAAPGSNGWSDASHARYNDRWHHRAQAGTLYLSDTALLAGGIPAGRFDKVRLYFENGAFWGADNLTVSGYSVTFGQSDFKVQVTNDLRIDTHGAFGIGEDPQGSNYILQCGTLTVTNGGKLFAFSGVTNNSSQEYGTLVQVDGDVVVGPYSWIYPDAHQENGATVLFTVGSMDVARWGGFDANGKGYECGMGPGGGQISGGYGPGGGHGGQGGDSQNRLWDGVLYGVTNAPVEPGSGGGTHSNPEYTMRGGAGGGSIRIDADGTVRLKGTMMADGAEGLINQYGGGGSGGSIYLFAQRVTSGSHALLSAVGGDSYNGGGNAGAGGGGRIAIWEGFSDSARATLLAGGTVANVFETNNVPLTYDGSASVTNGTGYDSANDPTPGTIVYLYRSAPPGTVIILR